MYIKDHLYDATKLISCMPSDLCHAMQAGSELASAPQPTGGWSARSSPVKPLILPAPDASVARPQIESPGAARRLAVGIYLERDSSGDSSGVAMADGSEGVNTARRRLDPTLLRTASPPLAPGSLSRTASPGLLSSRLQRPPLPVSCQSANCSSSLHAHLHMGRTQP